MTRKIYRVTFTLTPVTIEQANRLDIHWTDLIPGIAHLPKLSPSA